MLAEIQVIPQPSGTATNEYEYVDAAINLIQESGLSYEVGALGTSIEGPSDEVWDLLRRVIEISVESGAESAVAQIKIGYFPGEEKSIASLTSKFRVNR